MPIQLSMPVERACSNRNQRSRRKHKKVLFIAGCCSLFSTSVCAQYRWDEQVLYNISQKRDHGKTEFYKGISNTSNYLSVALPAILMTAGALENDKETLHKGLYIMEAMAVNYAITYTLKQTVDRKRPFVKNTNIICVEDVNSPSFPSGHTSQAFATATAVTIAYPKWYVGVPMYLWASSVGYSRMYLGVHYPSDVAAGAVIGAGSAWLTYKANKWIRGRKAARRGKELKTVW